MRPFWKFGGRITETGDFIFYSREPAPDGAGYALTGCAFISITDFWGNPTDPHMEPTC